jgi:hypothetical protein
MSSEDVRIWQRWRLTDTVRLASALYFDVGFTTTQAPPGTPENMARMWERVTAARADVVIDAGARWLIVELRAQASSSAIGRLLYYRTLWQKDPPDDRPVELILVTNAPQPGLVEAAQGVGIKLEVV